MKKIQEYFVFIVISLFLFSACGDENDIDAYTSCVGDCQLSETRWIASTVSGICGEDGYVYANECQMACESVSAAPSMMHCRKPNLGLACKEEHYGIAHFRDDGCTLSPCLPPSELDGIVKDQSLCEIPAPECFDDCEACSNDSAEWLCATDEALYCNACVMACLEAEAADDGESCVEPVAQATACDDEGAIAGRDTGCNRCECKTGLWHCSDHACP